MKRPVLFLSIICISIICSTALVSTAISSIAKSFNKNDTEKSIDAKNIRTGKQLSEETKQASIKL